MAVIVDALTPDDWEAVLTIYQQGLSTGLATFETRLPTWDEWDGSHLPCCRLAARQTRPVDSSESSQAQKCDLLGWAAASPVSKRPVYRGVAEVSIYVAEQARGQGLGKLLLNRLIGETERAGIWTLQAVIFAENAPSLTLHQSCGFRWVGRRERIARRGDTWHDTILLERRSQVVGLS
jgi:L-amino acid N-acyltransferase YncA